MKVNALLLLLALALLLPGTSTLPLMDRDEPRFAQATVEMMETGQWTIPYFNGEHRFDKPPLTYWWMRIHYWILGRTELAARLHSVVAAWLAAVVIRRIGTLLYSKRTGTLAGIGFLTCLQVLVHGRLCVADMPMVLAVAATMDALLRFLKRPAHDPPALFGRTYWYLVGALAFGFLAKGPVAWAVPLLALLLCRWPFGAAVPWSRLPLVSAFGAALAIVAVWGIPAMAATDWEYFRIGIGTHVVERGLKPFNSRAVFPGIYYLATVMVSLLPWGAFAWGALYRGGWPRGDPDRSFLLAWYTAPFLLFSFYSTQLPHYVLPGFPAYFLLLFRNGRLPSLQSRADRVWFATAVGGAALLVGIAGATLIVYRERIPQPFAEIYPLLAAAVGIVTLLSVGLPLLVRAALATHEGPRGLAPRIALFVIPLAAAGGILSARLAEGIRERHHAVLLAALCREVLPEGGASFCSYRFGEPSQIFYGRHEGGNWAFRPDLAGMVKWLERKDDGPRVGVFLVKTWRPERPGKDGWIAPSFDEEEAVREALRPFDYEIREIEGFNVARTTWEKLLVAINRSGKQPPERVVEGAPEPHDNCRSGNQNKRVRTAE